MKIPGMMRKVDELGRIVIPHELRKMLNINNGDLVELGLDGDTMTIQKFYPKCVFCGSGETLSMHKEKYICAQCLQTLKRG